MQIMKRMGAALLSVSLIISALPLSGQRSAKAAEVTNIYATAYVDTTDVTKTSLPEMVEVNGDSKEVTWNLSEDQFKTPYSVVEVTGKTGDNDEVKASVEVIPQDLVFFADIGGVDGMGGKYTYDSPVYETISNFVKESTESELINDKADAVYTSTIGWGHNAYSSNGTENRQYKAEATTTYDKSKSRGLYTNNEAGAKITYKVPLEAGTYTVAMGLFDWWDVSSRTADIFITTPNEKKESLGTVSYSNRSMVSYLFTVKEKGEVLFELAAGANDSPLLSWIGVSEGELPIEDIGQSKITIDGDNIATENINGLTFKGFGLLSGNSTSDLLMDYKAEQPEAYAQLMQYLFGGEYPIMTHVKLEMGNDCNNSTGPESSTKRSSEEKVNVLRNPGWQLAADAKKINPNIKVSILRWNKPVWAKSNEDVYTWYKESILEAYEKYGYMVDYINPNVNEHWGGNTDVKNTKSYAKWIAAETKETITDDTALKLYKKIKLVVSDEAGTVSKEVANFLKSDVEFYNSVDVVGYHYNPNDDSNGGMTWLAEVKDKEVWNSEAQATFSNSAFRPANNVKDPTVKGTGIGGTGSALEMGNTFIKGFVKSRRSHVIYQPGIGSFYEGGQYAFKELVSARDPWSGWIHYDAGLLILSHLSKFAVTGWENEENTAGIWRAIPESSNSTAGGTNPVNGRNGGENYMTLAAPTKDNFSTVIMNDSEYPMTYDVKTVNMNLKAGQKVGVWETRAADNGAFNENYMKHLEDVSRNGSGSYTIQVKPYSAVTVTTLDVSKSKEHTEALPVEEERTILDTDSTGTKQDLSDEYLYADDFEYAGKTVPVLDGKGGFTSETEDYIESRGGDTGAMARYTHTLNGAFETYKTSSGNHVLRQQLDKDAYGVGGAWNSGDPVTLIGDFRWTNYAVSVDALFEHTSNSPYAAVAIRQIGSSHILANSSGYTLKVFEKGDWELYRKGEVVLSGNVSESDGFKKGDNVWNNLKLEGAGSTINAYINNKLVATYEDKNPITAGRVGLGSASTFTQFDNLKVLGIDGYVPYYTELLDNMEIYDLTPEKKAKLVYSDKWNHKNGMGMYVYQRSMSNNTGTGATLSYTFTGTGLEVLAGTNSTATIRTTVDEKVVSEKEETQVAGDMNMIYSLKGLTYGKHTVTLEVKSGTLSVDMVGILGDVFKQPEPIETTKPQDTPKPLETDKPSETSQPIITATPPDSETIIQKGTVVEVGAAQYKVADVVKKTVEYKGPKKNTVTSISIPDTVKLTIDGKTVSYKVTGISSNAFTKCKKLKSVTIGKNIKTIGKNAFSGCKNLKSIKIKSTSLKTVGVNAIKGIHKKAVISCSKKKVTAYKKLFSAKTGFNKKTMKVKKL